MPDYHREATFNPCFCTTVRCGSMLISVFDIIYGAAYIARVWFLDYTVKHFHLFYPEKIDYPHDSELVKYWLQYGNYAMMILSGIWLFSGIMFMNLKWTSYACYIWVACRVLLTLTFSIMCHIVIYSETIVYSNYGVEILINILIHIYFICVVYCYGKDADDEYRSLGTIAPIGIRAGAYRPVPWQKKRRLSIDLLATSMYEMSPRHFLSKYASTVAPTEYPDERDTKTKKNSKGDDDSDSWDEDKYRAYLGGSKLSTVNGDLAFLPEDARKEIALTNNSTVSNISTSITSSSIVIEENDPPNSAYSDSVVSNEIISQKK